MSESARTEGQITHLEVVGTPGRKGSSILRFVIQAADPPCLTSLIIARVVASSEPSASVIRMVGTLKSNNWNSLTRRCTPRT
jgi:hypothetical protein